MAFGSFFSIIPIMPTHKKQSKAKNFCFLFLDYVIILFKQSWKSEDIRYRNKKKIKFKMNVES